MSLPAKHQIHLPPERPATDRDVREMILGVEQELEALPDAKHAEDIPLEHFFASGTYTRKITLPAGMMLTGAIHKHETMNIITTGHVRVVTETEGVKDIIAPAYFIGPKCTKRLIYVIEECVWCTIHTDFGGLRDPDELREALAWDSYDQMPDDLKELLE